MAGRRLVGSSGHDCSGPTRLRHADVPLHGRARQRAGSPLAGVVGRPAHLRGRQPRRSAGRQPGHQSREDLHPRHVPVPERHRPARRTPVGLHRHRRLRPVPAHGRQERAVHDGLRRLRPARRAVRRADRHASGGHHPAERRCDAPPAAPHRAQPRPPAQHRHHRSRLLPLDAVDLPAGLQQLVRHRPAARPPGRRAAGRVRRRHPPDARRPSVGGSVAHGAAHRDRQPTPGLRQRRAGQLVPRVGHRRGQRGGHRRRPQRPRQLPRLQAQHAPVDDAHHRLRRPVDRRSRSAGVERRDQVDAAQLDRSQRGRDRPLRLAGRPDHGLHDSCGHVVRRHVHGAGTRAPPGRSADHTGAGRRRERLPRRRRRQEGHRSTGRRAREDRRVHRRVRDQPDQRRVDPGVGGRLRADGLRHRGDHGRPVRRPARLRVRPQVRAADRRHPGAHRRPWHRHDHVGRSLHRRRAVREQRQRGTTSGRHCQRRRGQAPDARMAERTQRRQRDSDVQAARLVVQPSALLGRAVPGGLRRRRHAARPARQRAAVAAAGDRQLLAAHVRPRRRVLQPGEPARPAGLVDGRRAGSGRRTEALPPRQQRHAAVGRQLLVRAALPRSDERERLRRPRGRAVLDGPAAHRTQRPRAPRRRRPVRRRRRARRAAPAVLALLAQGAVRPRAPVVEGAVLPAVQPGVHPGRGVPGRARAVRRGGRGPAPRRRRQPDLHLRGPAGHSRVGEDGQEPEERRAPRRHLRRLRRRHAAPVRDEHRPAGRLASMGDA